MKRARQVSPPVLQPVVIKCYGPVNDPELLDGEYLKVYDIDAHGGLGYAEFTLDLIEALKFPDLTTAIEFSRQVSKRHPVRADGKPNRPLTAFHMEYITL